MGMNERRISQKEVAGMDEEEHGEVAYPASGRTSAMELGRAEEKPAGFLEEKSRTWRSPDASDPDVKFLGFRKMSDSSQESGILTGLVNEAFEEEEPRSEDRPDGTQETHFGGWQGVTQELQTSLAKIQTEKEAEVRRAAREEAEDRYGEETKAVDFGEESDASSSSAGLGSKVVWISRELVSELAMAKEVPKVPLSMEYSSDSRESTVI